VPALLIVVVLLDQALKWWAWRHVPWTRINSGGDALVGRTIGAWYAGPVTGALLDGLDLGLLSVAAWVLARCRATAGVVVPGALMTGGWASNLLDRLGIHHWTTSRTSSSSAARRSSCWRPATRACGRPGDWSR
jgi:lipoprotein signal peptidase